MKTKINKARLVVRLKLGKKQQGLLNCWTFIQQEDNANSSSNRTLSQCHSILGLGQSVPHFQSLVRVVKHVVPVPQAIAMPVQAELNCSDEIIGCSPVVIPHLDVQLSRDDPHLVHLKHEVLQRQAILGQSLINHLSRSQRSVLDWLFEIIYLVRKSSTF